MRSFLNIASILVLLIMVAACAKLTVDAIDKTQEQRDRAELVRCQNHDAGWARACQNVQARNESINTLGGQQ